MTGSIKRQPVEFGPFRLDLDSRHLWRDAEPVHLTPKVFDLLVVLVENEGRVLSKEEIMRAVWPDRHVEEANLTQSVSVLRRALGEVESGKKFIATFPGKGYQFLVPVKIPGPETRVEPAPPVAPVVGEPASPPAVKAVASPRWPASMLLVLLAAACAVAAWFWLRPEARLTTAAERRIPFTRLPGGEYQPAFSAQGTKVAFTWEGDDGHPSSVWVRSLDEDSPKPAAADEGVAYSSPAWSPDAHHLAMLRKDSGTLKLVVRPDRGVAEREIARLFPARYGLTARQMDWSPDGRLFAISDKERPESSFQLYLVDAQTGERRMLTNPTDGGIGDTDPRFSPDGKRVSFVRMSSRFHQDLYSIDAAGANDERKHSHDDRRVGGQDWSADASSLYWASDRDGQFRIWRVGTAPGAKPEPAFPSVAASNPIQFSIARTTEQLTYSEFVRDLNIWRLDVGSGRWTRIISSTAEDTLPQLSPDGRKLSFNSDRTGAIELWVSDADGGNAVQLTRGARQPVMGRWSVDSKSVVFNEATTQRMFQVDVAGGLPRQLGAPGLTGFHPIVTRDGLRTFFSSGSDHKLCSMALSGGEPNVLASNIGFSKVLSKDGKQIYFADSRTEPLLSRIDLATLKRQTLVRDLAAGYWGAWALAPHGIYYLRNTSAEGQGTEVAFHELATGNTSRVSAFPGNLPPLGTSAWSLSPDGKLLYAVRADTTQSDLVLIEPAR